MEKDEEVKMISSKWVVTNKGTEEHPIAKARLVAREFSTGEKRGELFAGTPGLMAMRTFISRAMTKCENGAKRSIMLADVKTAFLYGDARRSLYVELPPGRYVGKLERAMCGTRDAPMIWQDHLRETLLDMKFKECISHPGVFQHEPRDSLLCVNVDDLFAVLRCTRRSDVALMGEDDDMVKKSVYLGRTLEWSENGLSVRPDRRHVRSLLRELGMENCQSISTPLCATVEKEGNRSDRPEVSAELATKHRAAVTRVVYVAQDRQDLAVAAVELAQTMAIRRESDDERLKRVARCFDHGW